MHPLAERVLGHIRRYELLLAGDRVGVAVSGGIDSVALLRLLLELRGDLGVVLSVVHFNHKLRGAESDADQEFVANLARAHDLEFDADSDDVAQHAADENVSVEAAARELRYGFFRCLLGEGLGDPQGLKPKPLATNGAAGSRSLSKPPSAHLNKIVTGHTLDDQAETVLMRLIRGAGLRGLGGIHPRIVVDDDQGEACGEIVRPLLQTRRRDLEKYLRDIGQSWREDSTNTDTSLTRNRVRKLVIPLLEKEFNPSVAENLSELADIARGEEDYWDNEAAGWLGTSVQWSEPEWARAGSNADGLVQIALGSTLDASSTKDPTSRANGAREMGHPGLEDASSSNPGSDDLQSRIDNAPWLVANASVSRMWFLGEPVAVQRRLVKVIGERAGIPLEFKHVEEILRFAAEDEKTGKELSLPRGWKVVRQPEELLFVTPDLRKPVEARVYEYRLEVGGLTEVAEAGFAIAAHRIPANAVAEYNPDELLDADSLAGPLLVRNWRAGDRYWPAHTKSPKKIKELLQERHVAQPERGLWPVVANGDEIVWVRGFPVPAKYRVRSGREAVLITETSLARKPST
ncbi:MAG TPA: tRNA lysidine(34) synthetase TilS [Candidatus Dormibacteraeota bacterium]|nr:tRNA lysidine(34) synthetase TilS [Candidatus Dormibacteraeota bacterium]